MNADPHNHHAHLLIFGGIIPVVIVALASWIMYAWFTDAVAATNIPLLRTAIMLLYVGWSAIMFEASVRRAVYAYRAIRGRRT